MTKLMVGILCLLAAHSVSAQFMKVKTTRGEVFSGYPLVVTSNELVLVFPGSPTSRVAVASIASTEFPNVDPGSRFALPSARLTRLNDKTEEVDVEGFRNGKLLIVQERVGGNYRMPLASAQLNPRDFKMLVFEDNMALWLASFSPKTAGGVPVDVMSGIRAKAAAEWPGNYAMQKFEIDRQVKAYRAIHGD